MEDYDSVTTTPKVVHFKSPYVGKSGIMNREVKEPLKETTCLQKLKLLQVGWTKNRPMRTKTIT